MGFYTTIKKYTYLSLLAIILSACAPHVVDRDVVPLIELSDKFSVTNEIHENPDFWWYSFDRPSLNNLIQQSLDSNLTLAQALERIKQAQASTIQTRSGLYPQIDFAGNLNETVQNSDRQRASSSIGGAFKWEVDVFNRLGSAVEADKMTELARIEDANAVRLSLSAEVANAYFGAIATHQRLQLLNDQVTTDKDLLELLQLRMDNGIGTNVEVLQQRSRIADSESLIPSTQSDLRLFENRIDVLLGQMPDAENRISTDETLDFIKSSPIIGVPSDLLLNRPDLRSARAELIAADADIASAIAERLPRITLDGSYTYSDTASFTGPVGMLMAGFVQPLLDWGNRKAEVERNKSLYREKLASFTQIYLEAVEDVENTLYQEKQQQEFITRLEQRRNLLGDTMIETEARYKQGIDDYLPVLNALQELRTVERDLIAERLSSVNIRIALHRAIGGAITPKSENKTSELETE